MKYLRLRKQINADIKDLDPWYQPIHFGHGIFSRASSKNGKLSFLRSIGTFDRGIRKWYKFIKPNLPFDLKGKRVLEIGCNAGLFLQQSIKEGAIEGVGIEKDDRYYAQAKFTSKAISDLTSSFNPGSKNGTLLLFNI